MGRKTLVVVVLKPLAEESHQGTAWCLPLSVQLAATRIPLRYRDRRAIWKSVGRQFGPENVLQWVPIVFFASGISHRLAFAGQLICDWVALPAHRHVRACDSRVVHVAA